MRPALGVSNSRVSHPTIGRASRNATAEGAKDNNDEQNGSASRASAVDEDLNNREPVGGGERLLVVLNANKVRNQEEPSYERRSTMSAEGRNSQQRFSSHLPESTRATSESFLEQRRGVNRVFLR